MAKNCLQQYSLIKVILYINIFFMKTLLKLITTIIVACLPYIATAQSELQQVEGFGAYYIVKTIEIDDDRYVTLLTKVDTAIQYKLKCYSKADASLLWQKDLPPNIGKGMTIANFKDSIYLTYLNFEVKKDQNLGGFGTMHEDDTATIIQSYTFLNKNGQYLGSLRQTTVVTDIVDGFGNPGISITPYVVDNNTIINDIGVFLSSGFYNNQLHFVTRIKNDSITSSYVDDDNILQDDLDSTYSKIFRPVKNEFGTGFNYNFNGEKYSDITYKNFKIFITYTTIDEILDSVALIFHFVRLGGKMQRIQTFRIHKLRYDNWGYKILNDKYLMITINSRQNSNTYLYDVLQRKLLNIHQSSMEQPFISFNFFPYSDYITNISNLFLLRDTDTSFRICTYSETGVQTLLPLNLDVYNVDYIFHTRQLANGDHLVFINDSYYNKAPKFYLFDANYNLKWKKEQDKYYDELGVKLMIPNFKIRDEVYLSVDSNYILLPNLFMIDIHTGDILQIRTDYQQDSYSINMDVDVLGNYYYISAVYNQEHGIYTFLNKNFNGSYARAYFDFNKNNIQDAGEPNYTTASYHLDYHGTSSTYSSDNSEPYLAIRTDTGSNTLSMMLDNQLFTSLPTTFTTSHTTTVYRDTVVFAVQPTTPKYDASVYIGNTFVTRPGFAGSYVIRYTNSGNMPISDATLKVVLDNRLLVDATSVPHTLIGDTLVFYNLSLGLGEYKEIFVQYTAATPPTLNVSDTLRSTAYIQLNTTDIHPNDNTHLLLDRVVGSYDPNIKTVNYAELAAHEASTTPLVYTIQFENRGTDTAFAVRIYDTLPLGLDASTLQVMSSSHDYTLQITQDSILLITFKSILLPAAATDSNAAHGYISFSILPTSDYDLSNGIANDADIVFDYNLPVTTPEATTTFLLINTSTKPPYTVSYITAYPNPASQSITLDLQGKNVLQASILDLSGRQYDIQLTGSSIDIQHLAAGEHILQLRTEEGVYMARFVKQ